MSEDFVERHKNLDQHRNNRYVDDSKPVRAEKDSPLSGHKFPNKSESEHNSTILKADLENNLVDQSYVIVSSESDRQSDAMNNKDLSESTAPNVDTEVGSSAITRSQRSNGPTSSAASTNDSRRSSFQEGLRKSGSFMSRLNGYSRSEQANQSNNLPSTLAQAISSISTFTSNFSLGSSSTLNGSQTSQPNRASNTSSASLTIDSASISTRLSQLTDTKDDVFIRKATLERKNLISLTKLVVKDLISSSLVSGRTIESDCQNAIHLNNYFTLIERVLKHGLKHNLLSNRSTGLWMALDKLSKYLKESTLMSESIRSLAYTKTPDGKIKAWMRLAMMQKKLPEYFNELLAQRETLLKDIYYDCAFMLNDEAHVFAGLIIGVNVIDCNFFVKDDNFDLMDDIIDLSPYLRAANNFDDDAEEERDSDPVTDEDKKSELMKSMTKILDQKNYLEEYNKHLESTISNLNAKIKALEEQNSRLELESKVSEVRIAKLQERRSETLSSASATNQTNPNAGLSNKSTSGALIPDAIRSMIQKNRSPTTTSETNTQTGIDCISKIVDDPIQAENPQASEQKKDEPSEAVDLEVSKSDDVDESLLEQDRHIRENSATLKNASQSPSDAALATELAAHKIKLAEQETILTGLRERTSILETSYRVALDKIRVLERDLDIQTSMNSDKNTTISVYEKDIRELQQQVESLRSSLADAKKLNADLSDRLNDTSVKLKDRLKIVGQLQASLDKWKLENKTLASRLQDKQTAFVSTNKDLERSLEQIKDLKKYNEKVNDELRKERECGQSSSVTVEEQTVKIAELTEKLRNLELELGDLGPYKDQYETLKKRCQDYEQSLEEVGAQLRESRLEVENLIENSSVFLDSQWMDSKQVKQCALCQQSFSVTRRKHHCRLCGNVFCQTCSDNKMELASSAKPARVCDTCHAFLLAKFVKSASSSNSITPSEL